MFSAGKYRSTEKGDEIFLSILDNFQVIKKIVKNSFEPIRSRRGGGRDGVPGP